MSEHLENPQTHPRRMTLRQVRTHLNLQPKRFTINKYIPNICTGAYFSPEVDMTESDPVLGGDTGPAYQFEEVNLSTITYDDVVLFCDAEIPFWIPYDITEHTIRFHPCGIRRKVGERWTYHMGSMRKSSVYQYRKSCANSNMDVIDDTYRQLEDKTGQIKELVVASNVYEVKMNKKMKLRNGDRREIKVRKFTGTETEMILNNELAHEASMFYYKLFMWRVDENIHHKHSWNGSVEISEVPPTNFEIENS